MYIYTSAEASMASGRVDAGPSILKTLPSPNPGDGFPPLTLLTTPAQPVGGYLGKVDCLLLLLLQVPDNIQYLLFLLFFDNHKNHQLLL